MQPVFTVSEPSSRKLLARGMACSYGFRTYLQGAVGQRCSLLIQFLNLPPGDCKPGCSQCLRFPNLPQGDCQSGYRLFVYKVKNLLPEDCKSGMQSVYKVSEPTSRELSAVYAFLYGFQTYLQGTVCRVCILFLHFTNLHSGEYPLGCILFLRSKGRSLLCLSHFSFPSCRCAFLG